MRTLEPPGPPANSWLSGRLNRGVVTLRADLGRGTASADPEAALADGDSDDDYPPSRE